MLEKILIKEIVNPIFYILIGTCIYLVISRLLKRTYRHKAKGVDDRKKKTIISLINNVIKYVIAIIVILMILEVYNVDTSAILASLGIVGLIIGLALQDMIKDFIAGVFIVFDNQYNIGDTVTINDFKGEVVALGLKSTKIRAYTGEIMTVANGTITEVINHSQSSSLAIVDVEVSYKEDLDHVVSVLDKLCKKLTKEIDKLVGDVELFGVTGLDVNGVRIRVTAMTEPLEQSLVAAKIRKAIKDTFDKEGITIPSSQVVVYDAKGL